MSALLDRLRMRPLAAVDGDRLTAGATVDRAARPAWPSRTAGRRWPPRWPRSAPATRPRCSTVLDPVAGPGGRFDGMLATGCNDTRRRLAPGEVAELHRRWRTGYPIFGGPLALQLLACAPWPTGGPPAPGGPAEGAPPILVIGTAADPRNSPDGARSTADSLASARFLSWQGAGTGAYPRTPCVRGVVDAELLGGVIPQPEVLCPP